MLFMSTPVLASDESGHTCGCDGCSCLRLYVLIILLTDPCDTFIPCSWSSRVIWFLPFPFPAKYADITFSLIAGSTGANITNYHLATWAINQVVMIRPTFSYIEQALTYLADLDLISKWSPFLIIVTLRIYQAPRSVRHPCKTRRLWRDATCISILFLWYLWV